MKRKKQTNSFIRILGESTAGKSAYGFILSLEMEFERFFLEFLFGRSDSHHAVRHVQKPKNVYILRHALPSTTHESMEVFFM